MEFGLREFVELRKLIYAKSGIHLGDEKVYFLKRRVEKRMEELGIEDPEEYLSYLRFFDRQGRELQELIEEVTVNETYFFREFPQLQAFAEHCLPDVLERKKKSLLSTRLRLLSAGCSTGEEAYTLAIILREMVEGVDSLLAKIVAVDIDRKALDKALLGIYDTRSVRDVPRVYLERYFDKLGNGTYRVKNTLRDLVTFKQVNLADRDEILSLGIASFDFIFCRNVLIYFSDEVRRRVVENFYLMLQPGGYIFLGHSESLSRISTAFALRRMGGYLVYQKPENADASSPLRGEVCNE
jgi:chemotaxis protein methyltransferase CheR